jgi:acetaldehyde dehydrogenase / alcohol dehydrogenase
VSELLRGEPAGVPRARMMLQRAHWAAGAFAGYTPDAVARIVEAVGDAAYQNAERYAEWAVRETGMGVVEHKRIKNEVCSRGIVDAYRDQDFASARIDAERRIVEVPRPAGVVLALTPSTNPVCSVYFKVLLALMTRNAIVVSPHPMARECCVDAARLLADAAVRAGAPDGCVQVVEEPTIPLIEALMSDETTNVIVATGGSAVVRAAYRSGNPAIGVGPGNVPVLVDATADLVRAARCIVDSKAFDNSILCTNESVLIAEERIADALERELVKQGAHICSEAEAGKLRQTVFPDGHWQLELVGKDAQTIARAADIRVSPRTRVLIAPFALVVPEEVLAREKLFPVLGLLRVADAGMGT